MHISVGKQGGHCFQQFHVISQLSAKPLSKTNVVSSKLRRPLRSKLFILFFLVKIKAVSFKKMHFTMLPAICPPFRSGLNMLKGSMAKQQHQTPNVIMQLGDWEPIPNEIPNHTQEDMISYIWSYGWHDCLTRIEYCLSSLYNKIILSLLLPHWK